MWETVACCDDCWWDYGYGSEAYAGVRLPTRIKQEVRTLEACHLCGWTTLSGIYVRVDTLERPAASLRVRRGM